MLIGINPLLSPDLLRTLCAMGHGDEIVIADANFPAEACAKHLLRADGIDAPQMLAAILSVMPLDTYDRTPANVMQIVGKPDEVPPVVALFQTTINDVADTPADLGSIERFSFYDRAKSAFAIVQTGERRLYGNIILRKGVLRPNDAAT
ncbi:ribose ABC transporter [Alphaproteobacteria bacterium KMM 3653]|uniref:Ribose ABC transporter n=1 Tax=Harenicola maris TaxID=2841044 RepID=A0AAP2CQ50_9RHOB|nr:ribose ABC transporter [Harenicola maris]